MRLAFRIERAFGTCQLAWAALFLIETAVPGAAAAVLKGEWSPPVQQMLPTALGTPETVSMRTAVVEIPGWGGSTSVRSVFRYSTGAVWIGLDYPGYCLFQGRIVGVRSLGSHLAFQLNTKTARSDEELSRIETEFIESLSSLEAEAEEDDIAVNVADVFGSRIFSRNSPAMHSRVVTFESVDWVDGNIAVRATTAFGDAVTLTFDGELQPWKARFNEREMLVVDTPVVTPKAFVHPHWSTPQDRYVLGKSGKLAARTRTTNYPLRTNVIGNEVQFMICLSEGGRLWMGTSGTDLIFTESDAVGFFLSDGPVPAVKMFRSSVRLPLDRSSRQVFKNWLDLTESQVKEGTYPGESVVVELSALKGFDASDVSSIRANNKFSVKWLGDGLEARVATAQPDGMIWVQLAAPSLEFISGEFYPSAAE